RSRWMASSGVAAGYFFFFSSRRRHTRSKRDWSSDVCSSDLSCTRPGGNAKGPLRRNVGCLWCSLESFGPQKGSSERNIQLCQPGHDRRQSTKKYDPDHKVCAYVKEILKHPAVWDQRWLGKLQELDHGAIAGKVYRPEERSDPA